MSWALTWTFAPIWKFWPLMNNCFPVWETELMMGGGEPPELPDIVNLPDITVTALADLVEACTRILAWVVGELGTVQAVWVMLESPVDRIKLAIGNVAPSSVE